MQNEEFKELIQDIKQNKREEIEFSAHKALNQEFPLTPEQIVTFMEALEDNTSVKKLVFNGVNFTHATVCALVNTLKHNASLQTLSLTNSNLNDTHVASLIEGLKGNHSLLELSLAGNPIRNTGVAALLKAIPNLNIYACSISDRLQRVDPKLRYQFEDALNAKRQPVKELATHIIDLVGFNGKQDALDALSHKQSEIAKYSSQIIWYWEWDSGLMIQARWRAFAQSEAISLVKDIIATQKAKETWRTLFTLSVVEGAPGKERPMQVNFATEVLEPIAENATGYKWRQLYANQKSAAKDAIHPPH